MSLTVTISEKANLIWAIADKLTGARESGSAKIKVCTGDYADRLAILVHVKHFG